MIHWYTQTNSSSKITPYRRLFIITFHHFGWPFAPARRNSLVKDSLGIRRQRIRAAAPEAETDRSPRPGRIPHQVRIHAHHPADSGGLFRQDCRAIGKSAGQRARRRTHHGDPPDGQGRLLPLAAGWKTAPDLCEEGGSRG